MNKYCVWDAIDHDFLYSCETLEQAKEYCHNQIKNGVRGSYIVGKWLNTNDPESTEYKELFRI